MTPAQTYARERREAVASIRQYTPDDELHANLIARVRPAIALISRRVDDAQIPLGASKFGGAPDVPDDFEVPTGREHSPIFLAQINLEQIAPFDIESALPPRGVLSFFAEIESLEENIFARVFHFPAVAKRLVVPAENLAFNPVTLTPEIIASPLNSTNAEFYETTGEPSLRGRAFAYDPPDADELDLPDYQLLGTPYCVQHDPRFNSAADGEDWRDWRLLLSIDGDSEAETMWDDSGMLYWTVRADDLKRANFENYRFHFDSC